MTPPPAPLRGPKPPFTPTLLILCLALAAPGLAADKKKTPGGTPSTLPPVSPRLAVPSTDDQSAGTQQPGKLINSDMSGQDLAFLMAATAAGREQAYFIELLKTKASSEQLKTLAQTLSGAQEEENRHLARLAAAKGWNVSLEPTAEQKKEGAAMEKLTGANFDKAAMDKILAASHAALTAYETAAQSSDPNVKTFASQMLPLAEEKGHLVEKMTGAGSKTAGQLFRHNVAEQTPSPAPEATPAKGKKGKAAATPKADPAASPGPNPTPKPKATPTPAASAIPVATPPGTGTPPRMLPPIVPSRGGPTPTLPQATPIPAPTPSKQGAG